MHLCERHVHLAPVLHHVGDRNAQAHQPADRLARLPFGARLQVLAEGDQGHDQRGGVVEGRCADNLREEGRDDAHQERRRRAETNQHVHIGAEVAQHAKRGAVEVPADVAPDRSGECQQQQILAGEAVHEEHREHHYRHREPDPQQERVAPPQQLAPAAERVGVRQRIGVFCHSRCRARHLLRPVAGAVDRADEVGGRHARRIVAHGGTLGGEVDAGRGDTPDLREAALDAARTRGARHATNRQFDRALATLRLNRLNARRRSDWGRALDEERRLVANGIHLLEQIVYRRRRGIIVDGRPLGRKIHARADHAGDLLQPLLDA